VNVFLSFASEDRPIAEQVQLALTGAGHRVFFDKESLPVGGDYHARIRNAIEQSDLFIYLVSAKSVSEGSYALTELKYARAKWPHPKGRVIPVVLRDANRESIPNYLNAVTWLEPEGNIAAEVAAAVAQLNSVQPVPTRRIRTSAFLVALVGLIAAGGALWWYWTWCDSYSPTSGPVSGLWRYSMTSEKVGASHAGDLELTMSGQSVLGNLKHTFDGSSGCVSGSYVDGTLDLTRVTGRVKDGPNTIQKYKLQKQRDDKFVGRFWNEEGGWPDQGSMQIER
jgi:TIR domain